MYTGHTKRKKMKKNETEGQLLNSRTKLNNKTRYRDKCFVFNQI